MIIALNISRIMTLRFKFSVKILIKIQTKRKRCIVYLVVVTTFFFSSFGYGIWNNDHSKNVSILYPTPCELMMTGNLGPMSDFFFFNQKNYVCIIGLCLRSIHRTFLWIKIGSSQVHCDPQHAPIEILANKNLKKLFF